MEGSPWDLLKLHTFRVWRLQLRIFLNPRFFLSLLYKPLICQNLQFHKKETQTRTELYLNNLYSSFRWVGVLTENHTSNDALTFCQQNPNTNTDKQECNNNYAKDLYLNSPYLNNMHLDNLCSQFDRQLVWRFSSLVGLESSQRIRLQTSNNATTSYQQIPNTNTDEGRGKNGIF